MRGARPWGSGRAAASQPVGAGLVDGRWDVQSGHFRRRFRCVRVWAEEERGVSVGPCGVHEGKRGSPMARGDAVARVAAWSERPAPPHHSLWAARRAQLRSLLERTVTNAHGLRDMSVHKPRRCQCALFIRVRFCTVYLVIKLSPGTPLLRVGALSSCLDLLRRGQSVRRVCGDPETCGLLRRNSRCRECTRA